MATTAGKGPGILVTKSGTTVTQLLLGGVVLGLSLLMILPTSIGIAEYNDRPLPVISGVVDQDRQNQMKSFYYAQIAMLVIACVGVVIGIYLMATSDYGRMKVEKLQYRYDKVRRAFKEKNPYAAPELKYQDFLKQQNLPATKETFKQFAKQQAAAKAAALEKLENYNLI